jgi:hypothetical protein
LTQAKFISDLQSFGFVSQQQLGSTTAWVVSGQGLISVLLQNTSVLILAGRREAALTAVMLPAVAGAFSSAPQTVVPMYLDRFDRYGYSLFYKPWEIDQQLFTRGDELGAIEFARAQGAGLAQWLYLHQTDSAENMIDGAETTWAIKAAAARDMPTTLLAVIPDGLPVWLANRYRHLGELSTENPGYVGDWFKPLQTSNSKQGAFAFGDNPAHRHALGLVQGALLRYAAEPNVVSLGEPHNELGHGLHQYMTETGPVAERSYQQFLLSRYGSLAALNTAHGTSWTSFQAVRLPTLDSFLGGDGAQDLGQQRWRFAPVPDGGVTAPPTSWMLANFDDSSWRELPSGPGSARMLSVPRAPTVWRTTFTAQVNGPQWLYVWDLAIVSPHREMLVMASLNGAPLDEAGIPGAPGSPVPFNNPHWAAFPVTPQAGLNSLSVFLPTGAFGGRVYLSSQPPRAYPAAPGNGGRQFNQRWVDFTDWFAHTRSEAVTLGYTAVRQLQPDKHIQQPAPDLFADVTKPIAARFGGAFHDTGGYQDTWGDRLPLMMLSAGLPFTVESGGTPTDGPGTRRMIGNYLTIGANGFNFYRTVGEVMRVPDVRAETVRYAPLLRAIGKYHLPRSRVALLHSDRNRRLLAFPFGKDFDRHAYPGIDAWSLSASLSHLYDFEVITEVDIAAGVLAQYDTVIGMSTPVLDAATVTELEQWVRRGGRLVAFTQTGRYDLLDGETWPISRLTGYRVLSVDGYRNVLGSDSQSPATQRTVQVPLAQTVYAGSDYNGAQGNGLRLQKIDAAATDLMLWADNTVAIGMRPLGQGRVFHVGAKFVGYPIWWGDRTRTVKTVSDILRWLSVGTVEGSASGVGRTRRYYSNNGLFTVWALMNDGNTNTSARLLIHGSNPGTWVADVLDGGSLVTTTRVDGGVQSTPFAVEPQGSRLFLTPRGEIERAAERWFELQRRWWQGADAPPQTNFAVPTNGSTVDLTPTWTTDLGGSGAGFTATFSVPVAWRDGGIELNVTAWNGEHETFLGTGRVLVDGQPLCGTSSLVCGVPARPTCDRAAYNNVDITCLATPGVVHTVTIQVTAAGTQVQGLRGSAFVKFRQRPDAVVDLAGAWQPSTDGLQFATQPITLPGRWNGLKSAKRLVFVPANLQGRVAVLSIKDSWRVTEATVNGTFYRSHHHAVGRSSNINVTPSVRWGALNEIELRAWGVQQVSDLSKAQLEFFDPATYLP